MVLSTHIECFKIVIMCLKNSNQNLIMWKTTVITKLKRSCIAFTLLCCQLLSSCSNENDLQFHFKSKSIIFSRMAFDQTEGNKICSLKDLASNTWPWVWYCMSQVTTLKVHWGLNYMLYDDRSYREYLLPFIYNCEEYHFRFRRAYWPSLLTYFVVLSNTRWLWFRDKCNVFI